jgi:serine/threonine protein kinase
MSEMSPAEEVFFAALEKATPAERAAYLDKACADSPALRTRVEKLLAAHPRVGDFLEPPAAVCGVRSDSAEVESTVSYAPSAAAGTIVAGKYKLLQMIGEGGMGAVWMADQTEPVKRRVAVKLIRVEQGHSKTIVSRFEAERQAIALMDHPHIAKLLDAGITGEPGGVSPGSPFFVMELVKGIPLTEYCDVHKLSIPQRLNLFVQICSAVQHAHQKGIIHRDLKPTNILIESHDSKPVPKIIDFGLAKATSGLQLTEQTLFTAFGTVMGTPLYMAPEQAKFNAVDVDTRADVYALGIILYELLTGTTPITRDSLKQAALDEMLKLIREQEAPTPSSRLSSPGASPNVAANRQMEPVKLGRFVKGELDWIAMKALAKERDRRYETANGFAKDIERFLNHEPVQAGPPTAAYRMKKFVRRNRGPVIAVAMIFIALVAGITGTTWQTVRATQAEGDLRTALDETKQATTKSENALHESEEARQKAEAVREFLVKLFRSPDPSQDGEEVKVVDILDHALAELDANLTYSPEVKLALLNALWDTRAGLGVGEQMVKVAEMIVAIRQTTLGPEHPDTLGAMTGLAWSYYVADQFDKAVPLAEEALKAQRATLGPYAPDTLVTVHVLGVLYCKAGRSAEAIRLIEPLIPIYKINYKTNPNPKNHHYADYYALASLAMAYRDVGRLEESVSLFEEALDLTRRDLGPANQESLLAASNLALAYRSAGRLEDALRLLKESVELCKTKVGANHPFMDTALRNLLDAYQDIGRPLEAVQLAEDTVSQAKSKYGPNSPTTLAYMNALGQTYQKAGQGDKALPLFEEILSKKKEMLGPEHPDTVTGMHQVAWAHGQAKRYDLALPEYEEALRLRKAKLGPLHPRTLHTKDNLIQAYEDAGKPEKALPLALETFELRKAKFGADHLHTLTSMNQIAVVYWKENQLGKSIPLFEETLKLREGKLGRKHPDTLLTVANLGENYVETGRINEGIALLEEAYPASQKYPALRWVGSQLLLAYTKVGEHAKFANLLSEQLAGIRNALPQDPGAPGQLAGMLAIAGRECLQQEKWSEAEKALRECVALREKTQPEAWQTFNAKSMLGEALLGLKKYVDAEPLLLASYEGMKQREKAIPPQGQVRLPEALDRLINLYKAMDKPDELKKWQVERAKYPTAQTPQPQKK